MSIEKIIKRSGEIVDFDREKIDRAVTKAYVASRTPVNEEIINTIGTNVIDDLEEQFVQAKPGVEDIQDIVEKRIADQGMFEVAKTYILYRQKQIEDREQQRAKVLKQVKERKLTVTKRDGSEVPFDVNDITELLVNCCGKQRKHVDVDGVIHDVMGNVYDRISTSEISQAVVMALKARIERNPVYSEVAARLLLNDLYKEVLGVDEFGEGFAGAYQQGLAKSIERGVKAGRLDSRLLEFDLVTLTAALDISRDSLFKYMGAQVLYDRYFLKDLEQNFLEIPQYFWMRVAMGLALEEKDKEAKVIEFYKVMSTLHYVPSTPTLFHAGTTHAQMSSCYLTTVEDDLSHIFKSFGDNAQLSKWSGGLGNDWTNIRATGSLIKSTNVGSQGVIPFLKIADATTAAINRSGKRRGATCVYLETWHYDIEDFLELRKNTGDERRRTHDTNTANWIPDLFMKRVMNDEMWTLFSPDETTDLHHAYGKDFEKKYVAYEKAVERGEIKLFKKIRAKVLWRKMITALFETGHPWMTFKDACNIRSPQDHVGVVHSSNLCTEITLNTSAEEIAVCNLGSINLVRHVKEGKLDQE
ncbi:ribonucleoside-diphosphate reductase subunit alpha, partial [Patescibacteria group bacterium]|nr:ribonucleoside-diphosphate reductase subunit alpha [Patescibacteria group bacterium]